MLRELPGWVIDNRTSVEREAAPYRGMSHEERWRELASLCRAAARQLAFRPERARLLDYQDPLPESSRRALARLREQARRRR